MKEKAADGIFGVLLIGLFILRFPVLILPYYKLLPISAEAGLVLFQSGTYLLTCILILFTADRLDKSHIDRFALALFLIAPVGKAAGIVLMWGWEQVTRDAWLNVIFSAVFLLALIIRRPELRRPEKRSALFWFMAAVAAGLCMSLVFGYFLRLQGTEKVNIPFAANAARMLAATAFLQLANAAALEEPLFRGFLWGWLKERHWKEHWIWLFQALLFMLGHIYYFGAKNYSFWIIVPVAALVCGWLAWKSRSIGTSMVAHSLVNALGNFAARIL